MGCMVNWGGGGGPGPHWGGIHFEDIWPRLFCVEWKTGYSTIFYINS